jgi:hypothetical protein
METQRYTGIEYQGNLAKERDTNAHYESLFFCLYSWNQYTPKQDAKHVAHTLTSNIVSTHTLSL